MPNEPHQLDSGTGDKPKPYDSKELNRRIVIFFLVLLLAAIIVTVILVQIYAHTGTGIIPD